MSGRALVVIDYQNIHLTAHDAFAPRGTPKHETLVHPLTFATLGLRKRNSIFGARRMAGEADVPPTVDLAGVLAFRGQPSQKHDATAYGRNQAQRSEWTRDPRVRVEYRTLGYLWDYDLNRYDKQEKGIDVLVALAVVRAAISGDWDVVVLASHDTDLEPALEMGGADAVNGCRVETLGWRGQRVLRTSGMDLWHTALGGPEFVQSRDRKDYR